MSLKRKLSLSASRKRQRMEITTPATTKMGSSVSSSTSTAADAASSSGFNLLDRHNSKNNVKAHSNPIPILPETRDFLQSEINDYNEDVEDDEYDTFTESGSDEEYHPHHRSANRVKKKGRRRSLRSNNNVNTEVTITEEDEEEYVKPPDLKTDFPYSNVPSYLFEMVPAFKPLGSRKRLQSIIEMVYLEAQDPDYEDAEMTLDDLENGYWTGFSNDVKVEAETIIETKTANETFAEDDPEKSVKLLNMKAPDIKIEPISGDEDDDIILLKIKGPSLSPKLMSRSLPKRSTGNDIVSTPTCVPKVEVLSPPSESSCGILQYGNQYLVDEKSPVPSSPGSPSYERLSLSPSNTLEAEKENIDTAIRAEGGGTTNSSCPSDSDTATANTTFVPTRSNQPSASVRDVWGRVPTQSLALITGAGAANLRHEDVWNWKDVITPRSFFESFYGNNNSNTNKLIPVKYTGDDSSQKMILRPRK